MDERVYLLFWCGECMSPTCSGESEVSQRATNRVSMDDCDEEEKMLLGGFSPFERSENLLTINEIDRWREGMMKRGVWM